MLAAWLAEGREARLPVRLATRHELAHARQRQLPDFQQGGRHVVSLAEPTGAWGTAQHLEGCDGAGVRGCQQARAAGAGCGGHDALASRQLSKRHHVGCVPPPDVCSSLVHSAAHGCHGS